MHKHPHGSTCRNKSSHGGAAGMVGDNELEPELDLEEDPEEDLKQSQDHVPQ